ncbi:hypothetical protein U271_01090 [Staphylococcus aureus F70893]|uniref:Uncharacterized protein n=1 Tax=Staphylococcus aureus TaxID=1280 RepID=A0A6J8WUX9_STAAU|nr:hypothetical protein T889_01158 [Staphylococcus aureus OCMM6067]EVG62456.1 hypothetical protein T890_00936 [Staphylococcus aureus OCMM6066]EVI06827.1 hypothetical protein T956_01407 [Staphylococcus aureus OCMM6095]EVX46863.1 hypothetical protein U271_01090 [Staphylococcus aureus F70893]EVX68002.1 hypothetical protein U280_00893 [Staphylococcus aureus F77047]EVZ14332.1 hypothetical protein U355_01298 [Staphylococcus aureus H48052]EVZ18310.1 hypothetical protein U356_01269 [Staphylococcus au
MIQIKGELSIKLRLTKNSFIENEEVYTKD